MLRFHFLLIIFGRLLTAFIAVISLRVMTTLLEPDDYGEWALLVGFQVFGSLFLINPVDQHVFRHTHAWWDNGTLLKHLKKYNSYIFFVSFLVAAVVSFWWAFTKSNQSEGVSSSLLTGFGVGSALYFSTWNIALNYLLNMMGFRIQSVILSVFSATVGLLVSALLVMESPIAIFWIYGQLIGAAVGAIGAWRMLRKLYPVAYNSTQRLEFSDFLNRKSILGFCIPLAAATGFMWLQNTGYRFWVGSHWGLAELGILVVGLGISSQLTAIVESLAMQFLYPYFARGIANADSKSQTSLALSDLMNVLLPVYAIWAGLNVICAAAIIHVIADTRYHAAIPFVIFGALIEFMRCTTNLWSNTARAIRRTKGLIPPYGFGAVVVWIGVVGLSRFDTNLIWLSSVLVLGASVTCGVMMILMQRLLPINIDIPRISISLIIMAICFIVTVIHPMQMFGLYQNLLLLLLSGVVASVFIAATLWRNPALIRLLSTPLRES